VRINAPTAKYSNNDIESKIKFWIRGGRDRCGGRRRRYEIAAARKSQVHRTEEMQFEGVTINMSRVRSYCCRVYM